jgi:hypothetical protein
MNYEGRTTFEVHYSVFLVHYYFNLHGGFHG